ncbi:MAG: uncharacterized protein HW386_1208 [Gammaproteobacteria bacterium]|nr:uncharacterized protein [Gammaproteobacteria bacterium]
MLNLFAYGTLMVPEVMAAVTGKTFRHEPATLSGYVRYRIKSQVFPAIITSGQDAVDGILYYDLNEHRLQRLDEFESEVYERREVHVHLADGDTVTADVYIVAPRHQHLLSSEPWDLGQFKEQYLQSYLSRL